MITSRNYPDELVVIANQNIRERDYWLNKLAGDVEKSIFPYDYRDHKTNRDTNHRMKKTAFGIRQATYSKLIEMSNGSDHTLHIIMTSVLFVLIDKYHFHVGRDIVVGIPIYRQDDKDAGLINKVLAIRNRLEADFTFKSLLYQVKDTVIEAIKNQDYPIEILAEQLARTVSLDTDFPLFDIIILLENIHDRMYIQNLKTNLIFSFRRTDETVAGMLEYNSSVYEERTVQRIINHFNILLQKILFDVDIPLMKIDILSADEKKDLLCTFNDTAATYPKNKILHELFEEQVEKTLHKTALALGYMEKKYEEINRESNRLARILRSRGVSSNTIVGVMLTRSFDMITVILAILKSGGAYLPIDPTYPRDRIKYILRDSNVKLLITRKDIVEEMSFTDLQDLRIIKAEPYLTAVRPQIRDFDRLPIPDRSLIDHEKYCQYIGHALVKHAITLQGTRGCPYNCSYCHKIWPKSHVIRSAEKIFEEVKRYYDIGVRRFSFVDDIFNLDVKNSSEFFNLILRHNLDVQILFPGGLRGDIMKKDYIDLMVEAGTIDIAVALETASPRLQKLIGKNLSIDKLLENLEYICRKHLHRLILELFTMHGFPTETEDEAMMTLNFLKGIKWVDFPSLSVVNIYPNTDMAKLAIRSGISYESIIRSEALQFHEVSETLPFDSSFTKQYQTEYLTEYFLLKERLLAVLPKQMKLLSQDEIVQKYHSYLPIEITCFDDLLKAADITKKELGIEEFADEAKVAVANLNEKTKRFSSRKEPHPDALRILHLDISQYFSGESHMLFDMVDPPLGLLYLVTYLNETFGSRVNARIAKSRFDYDSFAELKALLQEFKPDIIAARSLIFYKDFFHETLSMIKNWGFDAPVITGGPYATSSYQSILQDSNVDIVVLGEGEITYTELIGKIIENGGKIPGDEILKSIPGLAFVPGRLSKKDNLCREILLIDTISDVISQQPGMNLEPFNQPGDPVYAIYTSGTGGIPKGALIKHENVVRLMKNDRYLFDFNDNDVWTMFHSYCFDFSVWEMYGALLYGGKLVIIPEIITKSTRDYLELLKREKVTVLNQTPSAFYRLIDEDLSSGNGELQLRYVIFGGEALKPARLSQWRLKHPAVKLINMYGITETTVHVTYKEITDYEIENDICNIGKPIPTLTAYVLDENRELLPNGAAGELCVGGMGVGVGYLNRGELTQERFISDSYHPGEKLYRSGDLVKLLANGEMEYLGRLDQQVKIRGFRVEPGEIENRLLNIEAIHEALVVDREDENGDKYLCAYVVFDQNHEKAVDFFEIKNILSRDLPGYMIPAYFVSLNKIPLTANGKINRKELPEPTVAAKERSHGPANRIERKLAEIWSDVLNIDKEIIGRHSNFFDLGGHSLSATILISKIQKQLNVKIPLDEMFRIRDLSELSDYIKEAVEDRYIPIQPLEKKEYYVLSPQQKRLYILKQMDPSSTTYNLPQFHRLDGNIDREKLENTFRKIIRRHNCFRTSFEIKNGEHVQRIREEVEFFINYSKCDNLDRSVFENFVEPFDFKKAPLFRVALVNAAGHHVLLLDMHHTISDAFTHLVLIEEFFAIYNDRELPALRLQYTDYAGWQNSEEQQKAIDDQESYWLEEFSGELPLMDLPLDYPRPKNRSFAGDKVYFEIDENELNALNRLARLKSVSLNIFLLSCLYIVLAKICNREDIIVGAFTYGRRHPDLERMMGMFVNTLAIRNYPAPGKIFSDFLEEVKINTLNAFENQEYPFERLVEKLNIKRTKNRNPLFDVMFGLQNVIDVKREKSEEIEMKAYNSYNYDSKIAHFELQLTGLELADKILFHLEYSTEVFRKETIDKIVKNYQQILKCVVNDKDVRIGDIEIESDLRTLKKAPLSVELNI